MGGGYNGGVPSLPNQIEAGEPAEPSVSSAITDVAEEPSRGPQYEELRGSLTMVRFHMHRKHAYEVSAVDDFLDQLGDRLASADTPEFDRYAVLELVRSTHFRQAKRYGYNMVEVDEFLEKLACELA